MKLFVTIYYHEVISHLQSNSNLYDEGIVKLPLYAIIFSSHEKIGSMGEEKNPEDLFLYFLISFLGARENNLLLSLLRNGSSLIYPFVSWRFYKLLFESIVLFWKY